MLHPAAGASITLVVAAVIVTELSPDDETTTTSILILGLIYKLEPQNSSIISVPVGSYMLGDSTAKIDKFYPVQEKVKLV